MQLARNDPSADIDRYAAEQPPCAPTAELGPLAKTKTIGFYQDRADRIAVLLRSGRVQAVRQHTRWLYCNPLMSGRHAEGLSVRPKNVVCIVFERQDAMLQQQTAGASEGVQLEQGLSGPALVSITD